MGWPRSTGPERGCVLVRPGADHTRRVRRGGRRGRGLGDLRTCEDVVQRCRTKYAAPLQQTSRSGRGTAHPTHVRARRRMEAGSEHTVPHLPLKTLVGRKPTVPLDTLSSSTLHWIKTILSWWRENFYKKFEALFVFLILLLYCYTYIICNIFSCH